jgi:hypothetical protein
VGTRPSRAGTLLFVLLIGVGFVGLVLRSARRTRASGDVLVVVGFLGAACLFLLWVVVGALAYVFE